MALADEQIELVSDTVNEKLVTVMGWAAAARNVAEEVISRVGTFEIPGITLDFPGAPLLDLPVDPRLSTVPDATVSNDPVSVSFTETAQVDFVAPPTIPDPVYGTPVQPGALPSETIPQPPLNYPQASLPILPGQPTFAVPTPPVLVPPSKPALVNVDVPDFEFPEIAAFNGTIPEYSPINLEVNPQVVLAEYDPSALKARIEALSQNAMPPQYVELCRRMTEELANTVDKDVLVKTEESFANYASKNFSIAPGMLIDEVNDLQSGGAVKIREGKQKINQEIFQITFENFKTAVAQGIALEKHLIDLHLEHARQTLEAEKIRVRAAVELFNAAVALHNSQQNARTMLAAAYKAELAAKIRVIESYKPLVDGAVAEIAENEDRLQMFSADVQIERSKADIYKSQISALTADIEAYKATLTGIKAQADVISSNINAYKDAVRAYAAGVDATTEELSAYTAQVQAASSGAAVYETNARAYAEYVQEAARRSGAYRAYASAQGDVLRANISAFQAASSANESFVRAQAAKFSAQAELAATRSSSYSAAIGAYSSYNKAISEHSTAMLTYAMVSAENAVRADSLAATARAETDRINAGAQAAKAQAIAGLAQGAMSAMYVSASAQGSGSTATSADFSYGVDTRWGGNTDKTDIKRQSLSA